MQAWLLHAIDPCLLCFLLACRSRSTPCTAANATGATRWPSCPSAGCPALQRWLRWEVEVRAGVRRPSMACFFAATFCHATIDRRWTTMPTCRLGTAHESASATGAPTGWFFGSNGFEQCLFVRLACQAHVHPACPLNPVPRFAEMEALTALVALYQKVGVGRAGHAYKRLG